MNFVIDRAATEAALRQMLATHKLPSGRFNSPGYRAAVYLAAIGIPADHIVGIADAIGVAGPDVFFADVDSIAAGGWQFDYPAEHTAFLNVPADRRADFREAIGSRLDARDERQAAWLDAALAAVPAS